MADIVWLRDVRTKDIGLVGGKNASLGQMLGHLTQEGINIPDGFAITSEAYREFIRSNKLERPIAIQLERFSNDADCLVSVGQEIRGMILAAKFSDELRNNIINAYHQMQSSEQEELSTAVRSSATAEDLPEASFAGQLQTFLNVAGDDELLEACQKCFASLYTDRAISYRLEKGFGQLDIAVSVGVQRMVRSDIGCSGVMFSIDTDTGFPDVVLISGNWGLGETIVQGLVDPDEFEVFKPLLKDNALSPIVRKHRGSKERKLVYAHDGNDAVKMLDTTEVERQSLVLSDADILKLGRWADIIERHYECPMDMEWAKDGQTGELFIVQARPETVQSQRALGVHKSYRLKERSEPVLKGAAVGDAIASGTVCRIESADDIGTFIAGSVLVTGMTDPDWVPIMKKAAAIVTDHGGRTSHAAIISRELGLPAVIGTGQATSVLSDGDIITVSCAEGEVGNVYQGELDFETHAIDLTSIPETHTKIMLILADPSTAFSWWRLPSDGAGLVRMEFIISNLIKVHPLALVRFGDLDDSSVRQKIEELTIGYEDKEEYFVDQLALGIARIAAAHHPKPVILRMSDFKTNEYAGLIGGAQFEPSEENPMLGWRGASRYYDDLYRAGFALECEAVRRVRDFVGLTNVKIMIPFCRTINEADNVIAELEKNGLKRGDEGLEIYVMAEIPSNVLLAEQFAQRFDGFSIGSNDLTQLTLGVDRDSAHLQELFDDRNEAVKELIAELLRKTRRLNALVGICGQAPSDYPDFARFLVENGIDSISVNPDSFIKVKQAVAAAEAKA